MFNEKIDILMNFTLLFSLFYILILIPYIQYKKIRLLKSGDKIIFYILGKKIVGIYEVISEFFIDETPLFKEGIFPYRIKLKLLFKTKVKEFTKELEREIDFLKNKISLGNCFQGTSLLNMSKEDFKIFVDYLKNEK